MLPRPSHFFLFCFAIKFYIKARKSQIEPVNLPIASLLILWHWDANTKKGYYARQCLHVLIIKSYSETLNWKVAYVDLENELNLVSSVPCVKNVDPVTVIHFCTKLKFKIITLSIKGRFTKDAIRLLKTEIYSRFILLCLTFNLLNAKKLASYNRDESKYYKESFL